MLRGFSAFLDRAGINLWGTTGSTRPEAGGAGGRRVPAPTDKPPDDTLKLHQEQQKLKFVNDIHNDVLITFFSKNTFFLVFVGS